MSAAAARRTVSVVALGLALAIGLAGCGGGSDQSGEAASSDAAGAGAPEANGGFDGPGTGSEGAAESADQVPAGRVELVGRAVVHRIDVTVEATDPVAAARKAGATVEAAGGFVESETTDGAGRETGPASVQMVLRVPVDRRGDVVASIEGFGKVLNRSRSAEDVTDQLVDAQSRIESQRRSIERLRTLLDDAGNLRDVISIEGELARREADLDSLLRRHTELSKLADLATVTATFARPGTVQPEEPDLGFFSGLRAGWKAFVQAMTVAATVVGGLLPFAIALALVGTPVWLLWRRQRKTPSGSEPA